MLGLAPILLLTVVQASATSGISYRQLKANDMTFDCAFAGESGTAGDVLLLHGNDGNSNPKQQFYGLMQFLAGYGLRSVTCDQRGFSPGASPQVYAAYHYDHLASDLFALADAAGFNRFHVVAHDQGARVTWHAIASSAGRDRFLSVSSLSIPHADSFSEALYGQTADPRQQKASQYVTVLTLNTAASTRTYCDAEKGTDVNMCQRKYWWYNGAIDSGSMALPPKNLENDPWSKYDVNYPHSNPAYGDAGVPQTTKAGNVKMPVLYACGVSDTSDLCGRQYPFATRSKELSNPDAYTYMELPSCGHPVMTCSTTTNAYCEGSACQSIDDAGSSSSNKLWAAILANLGLGGWQFMPVWDVQLV